jgi:hypothetical protein
MVCGVKCVCFPQNSPGQYIDVHAELPSDLKDEGATFVADNTSQSRENLVCLHHLACFLAQFALRLSKKPTVLMRYVVILYSNSKLKAQRPSMVPEYEDIDGREERSTLNTLTVG